VWSCDRWCDHSLSEIRELGTFTPRSDSRELTSVIRELDRVDDVDIVSQGLKRERSRSVPFDRTLEY